MTQPPALIDRPVAAVLAAEAEAVARRRVIEPARAAGIELPLLGVSELPTAPIRFDGAAGTWLVTSAAQDPTARATGGRVPVPAEVHRRLRGLRDAGVGVDLVWLAHELPAPGLTDAAIAKLVPPPRDGRLAGRVRGAIGRVAPLAGVGLAVAALDPIVLGGVRHPTAPAVAWVELARWTW